MTKEHILMHIQFFLDEVTRQYEFFSVGLSRYDIHDVQNFDSISSELTFAVSPGRAENLLKGLFCGNKKQWSQNTSGFNYTLLVSTSSK